MSNTDLPAPRPPGEERIDLDDALHRWPHAYVECMRKLHGLHPEHASTAVIGGERCLCLWASAARTFAHVPDDIEIAGTWPLPPELDEVREIIREAAA